IAQVQVLGVLATLGDLRALRRVVEVRQAGVVELEVGAAQGGQPRHLVGVGRGQVSPELLDVRVDGRVDRGGAAAGVGHGRRGEGGGAGGLGGWGGGGVGGGGGGGAGRGRGGGEVFWEVGFRLVALAPQGRGGGGNSVAPGGFVNLPRRVAGCLADPADLVDEV